MFDTAVAVVFTKPGSPDVLHVENLLRANPGAHEVRVRVSAAGVHPTDVVLRSGKRALTGAPPYVCGMAIAGVVDSAGEESVWQVGDRVMGMTMPSSSYGGGYRASVICPDDTLASVPSDVDLVEAATLPMNGHTSMQVLRLLEASDGEIIAVTGAAGALGSLVVPLAVSRGLRVIAIGRAGDEKRVRDLGATLFVEAGADVSRRIVESAGRKVDAIADLAVLDDAVLPAVRDGGTLVTLRGWSGPSDSSIRIAPVAVPAEWRNGAQLTSFTKPIFLTRPVRRFSPEDAADAHRMLGESGLRAGLVIAFE